MGRSRRTGKRVLRTSIGVLFIMLVAAILIPISACGCGKVSVAIYCMSKVKGQVNGLILYQNDHDDHYPDRQQWMTGIRPYVVDEKVFVDPESVGTAYGYAFNAKLSLAVTPTDDSKTAMVYDSVNPRKNASDAVTSLPREGRHVSTNHARNTVGYADGHVRWLEVIR